MRDEIEQLLDDDGDMAEMYLTDKLLAQQEGSMSPTSTENGFGPISPERRVGVNARGQTPCNLEESSLQPDELNSDEEDDR